MRGVWIEIRYTGAHKAVLPSLPMRGVWIEMGCVSALPSYHTVTPHAGSVD